MPTIQQVGKPRVRLRALPAALPLNIELQATDAAIQWRYVGAADDSWLDLVLIDDIDVEVTVGAVTTLAPGEPASVFNSGTSRDIVLDFGIPAGSDGLVQTVVAGSNITVDATDPNNPVVSSTGIVETVVAGAGISVDATDPANPIVSSAGSSLGVVNLGVAATPAASALTVALKQADGSTDASGAAPVSVGMRSSTAGSGLFNTRSVTGALSLVIPSGATLGQTSAIAATIFTYLIDNAGTLELALSALDLGESGILTSTTIGTGSDSATGIYSTTGRTAVPFRKVAELVNTQATAGTWATAPSEIRLAPFAPSGGLLGYVVLS